MTIRIGLTGSIGMGKSTTAKMFVAQGCAVWDADAAVARLYAPGGAATKPLAAAFPAAVTDGAINKEALRQILRENPSEFDRLNAIVHPLVKEDRDQFSDTNKGKIQVFDTPLLFENNSQADFDITVCVLTTDQNQQDRVMARGTMTPEDFALILSRQMPAAQKAKLADYVICTDTLATAQRDVKDVLSSLKDRCPNA